MAEKIEKVIHYDAPEAAQFVPVTGWLSADGSFWGKNEAMARYCGCTHIKCRGCELMLNKAAYRGLCRDCGDQTDLEEWQARPRAVWNGTDTLYSEVADEYFNDADELCDYCYDHGVLPMDLRLRICTPNMAHEIDPREHYADETTEDGDLPQDLNTAFEQFNAAIRACTTPLSWSPGKNVPSDDSFPSVDLTDGTEAWVAP